MFVDRVTAVRRAGVQFSTSRDSAAGAYHPHAPSIRKCSAVCRDAPAFYRPVAGCACRPATANGKARNLSAPLIPADDGSGRLKDECDG